MNMDMAKRVTYFLLRVVAGLLFFQAGSVMLLGWFGGMPGQPPGSTAPLVSQVGIGGILEFFGGIALILGFLTQVVAALIAVEMVATTIFSKTKLGKKLVLGYELDLAYLVIALLVLFVGPGAWSVDRLLGLG